MMICPLFSFVCYNLLARQHANLLDSNFWLFLVVYFLLTAVYFKCDKVENLTNCELF